MFGRGARRTGSTTLARARMPRRANHQVVKTTSVVLLALDGGRPASPSILRAGNVAACLRERRYTQEFRERHYDFVRRYVELKTRIERAISDGPG